jgi:hypothetical protein
LIKSPLLKRCWVRKLFFRKPSVPGFSCGGRSCGPPPPDRVAPPAATLFSLAQLPALLPGGLESHRVGRLLASALPWRCFPAARRELQHPRPTADPSVPPFAKKYFADTTPTPLSGEYMQVFNREKTYRTGRAGDLSVGIRTLCFSKTLCTWTSRQLLIPRIAAAGTSFNLLPCQAWHGYMDTNAHRVEV